MEIQIHSYQLKAALQVAGKKDIRYYLNSVFIERTSSGTVYLVATDGYKLLVGKLAELEPGIPEFTNIPRETIELVLKMKLKVIVLNSDAKTLGVIKYEEIEGKFFDWRRVIPDITEPEEASRFDPEYVLDCAKALTYWDNGKDIKAQIYQRGYDSALVTRGDDAFCVLRPLRKEASSNLPFKIEPFESAEQAAA